MWENVKKWLRKKLEMVEVTKRITVVEETIDGKAIERTETETITKEVK